jgi:hypothetical protein
VDKVEEYLKKIIKKSGDEQAYYSYYKENRSTMEKPLFMANIVWSKAGLSPLQLSCYSVEELTDELKKYYRTYNLDTLNMRYHQNQIMANELSIKYHKKMLEVYAKPPKKEKKK